MQFDELNLSTELLRSIEEMGYEQMTPIQEQAIPVMLEGKDIIGQAQTGTGKTAAFGIPVIESIDSEADGVQAIILCPTRELAIQTAEEIRKFAKFKQGVKVLPIYGGQDISIQIRSLRGNVPIVVGTPGRVMDHMRRHTLRLDQIKTVVLDEADEMLDMGFREDIETILAGIPSEHRTALFSATMPQPILDIVSQYQHDAVTIKITPKELTIPLVKQYYYDVPRVNKMDVVARLLDYYNPKLSLVFCNTKKMVEDLTESLKGRGYFAEGLHGDMSQYQRDKVMNSFRNGSATILVATDVAARGIDVDDVEAVFNYDIPQDFEYYVHRIGRTGRAGRKGRSFTLVSGRDVYKIRELERVCHTKMKERAVPSVEDVTTAKADKILSEAIEVLHAPDQDLSKLIDAIQAKLDEEECSTMDLAAAMLRMQMGDEEKEIPAASHDRGRSRRDGSGRSDDRRGRDGGYRRGDRDGKDGYHKRDDKDGFRKKDDKDGFRKRDDKDGFRKRDDKDGFRRRDDKDGFRKRDDKDSYRKRDDKDGFRRRGSSDGYRDRDDDTSFRKRDNAGEGRRLFGGDEGMSRRFFGADDKKERKSGKQEGERPEKKEKKKGKLDLRLDGSAFIRKTKGERYREHESQK